MASMKKVLAISMILIILLASFYLVASTYNAGNEDPGTPSSIIGLNLIKLDNNGDVINSAYAELDTDSSSIFGGTSPTSFTAVNIDVGFIQGNATYLMSFDATITAQPDSPGIEYMKASIITEGQKEGLAFINKLAETSYTEISSVFTPAQATTVIGNVQTSSNYNFQKKSDGTPITGADIHNSMFTITMLVSQCNAEGIIPASPITGSQTVDVLITVGAGGSIQASFTNISGVPVAADVNYPFVDGWDIPGNINYIVIAGTVDAAVLDFQVFSTGNQGHITGTLSYIETYLGNCLGSGIISQQQYDCGMAQIAALGSTQP